MCVRQKLPHSAVHNHDLDTTTVTLTACLRSKLKKGSVFCNSPSRGLKVILSSFLVASSVPHATLDAMTGQQQVLTATAVSANSWYLVARGMNFNTQTLLHTSHLSLCPALRSLQLRRAEIRLPHVLATRSAWITCACR